MLLPEQLARMRLGVAKSWRRTREWHLSAEEYSNPLAYSRIVSAPRVTGHNDLVGDCVPTMGCNAVQGFLARQGNYTPIPDDLAVQIYSAVTGYTPGYPATDQGTDPEQFFAWWKQNSIAGHKLLSAAPINTLDNEAVKHAIATSGGVSLAVNLAVEQQNQIVWTPTGQPGSWGGHSIWADQYVGLCGSTSWGEEKWIDWSFFNAGFVAGAWELSIVSSV